ncbi:unnamed protein product [Closterium sp. NIES-53]
MGSYVHPNNSWLPPDVAAQANSEEPGRFHAVAEEVQAAWKRGKEQGHGGETLKWVSVVNRGSTPLPGYVGAALLQIHINAITELIRRARRFFPPGSAADIWAFLRWASVALRWASVALRWASAALMCSSSGCREGSSPRLCCCHLGLLQVRLCCSQLYHVRTSSLPPPGPFPPSHSHFPPPPFSLPSLPLVRPQFADVSSNDALEAAALLNLLLPTTCRHMAPHEDDASAEWSVWVPEWLSLWSSIPHCTFWDAQWISLLARLAKHQQLRHQHQTTTSSSTSSPASLLSIWTPHLPFLFQKVLESFSLPIGQSPSATSAQLERPVSPACARVFLSLLDRWQQRRVPHQQQVVRAVAGAKLVIWLLANPESAAHGLDAETPASGSDRAMEMQGGASSVLRLFDKLSNDLEQFFHPSNGGEWTGLLEKMIHSATYHLMKRIAAEKKIYGDRYTSDAPSALTPATTAAFIRLLTRLIHNRALFSKSPTLSAVASRVAASLSYLAPRVTLPVVLESFQGALTTPLTSLTILALSPRPLLPPPHHQVTTTHQLESALATLACHCCPFSPSPKPSLLLPFSSSTRCHQVTATHQLESALSTLALSVRPLLLAASQTPSEQDSTPESMDVDGPAAVGAGEGGMDTWQEMIGRAREVVSEALVATLPGIDANDPPKTLATLHLYLSVFSSIGPIGDEESPFALSIDWSTWLEDFLSRLFSLFSHLESAAPTATVASAAAGTERSFLMKEAEGSTFRSTVSILFARLSPPLLNQVISRMERYVSSSVVRGCEEEIGTLVAALAYAAPEATCSRILAGVMDSAMSLLQSLPATSFLGLAESPAAAADAGEALKDRLIALIDAAFSSTSQKVVDAAADLLQNFLGWEDSAPGVERWFSKQAASATAAAAPPIAAGQVAAAGALQWHVPSTEETTLATQLIDKYLGGALRDIRWLRTRPATSASASSAAVGGPNFYYCLSLAKDFYQTAARLHKASMADGSWGLPNSTGDAGLVKSSFALVPRGAEPFPKTYTGYNRANKRSRKVEGFPVLPATIHEDVEHNKQAENPPAMAEMEVQNDGATDANPAASVNPITVDTSFTIPEPFKGWTTTTVRGFRTDFKALLKAKSKLKKMKTLNDQGVVLHSIRTKVVEFQTKYPSTREKSAASVASVHFENQKRIQADFIASKELEVEEILSASSSHLTTLATKLEDYIQGLTADPELTVSDAARERYRKIKGVCIERAKSEIALAKDDIIIRELERQRIKEADDLKKAAAAEEMDHLETDPAINELVLQATKKYAETMRKEITASVEAKLTAKFKKSLSMGSQDPKPAPSTSKSKADLSKDRKSSGAKADVPKTTRERGKGKKNAKSSGDGREKNRQATSTKLLLKRFPPAVDTALRQLAPCVAGEAGAVARLLRMGKSAGSIGGDGNGDREKQESEEEKVEEMKTAEDGEEVEEKEDREEAAVGACQVFVSRPIMRKIAYDWRALAPFLSALLAS